MDDTSHSLCHYGVPGMKWGVRRSLRELGYNQESKEIRKSQKAYDKRVAKNWYKAHNKAADIFNNEIGKLNQKWEGRYDDPKYKQEVDKLWGKIYTQSFLDMFGKRPI